MKRILLLAVMILIVLVGCNDDKGKDGEAVVIPVEDDTSNTQESDDVNEDSEPIEIEDDAEIDIEDELYIKMLNNLLNEYDEKYEGFTIESGASFYKMFKSIVASGDVDTVRNMTDKLLEILDEDEQEIYGNFLDDLIELEETFSNE